MASQSKEQKGGRDSIPRQLARVELRQLRYFSAVAKQQNFARAAAQLRIAQPALSRQIALLESELGVKLFKRHPRGVISTPEGELLLKRVDFALRYIEDTRQEVSQLQSDVGGTVILGLQPSLAEFLGPPLIQHCVTNFPNIRLSIVERLSPELRELVISGELDTSTLVLPTSLTQLHSQHLAKEPICLIGLPGSVAAIEGPIEFRELKGLPIILAGQERAGVRAKVARAAIHHKLDLNIVVEVESAVVARRAIELGLGYSVSVQHAVEREVREGLLAIRPISGLFMEMVLVSRLDRALSGAIREVQSAIVRLSRLTLGKPL
jgi:LysR family nitrogen assimilation transcriptional regulator